MHPAIFRKLGTIPGISPTQNPCKILTFDKSVMSRKVNIVSEMDLLFRREAPPSRIFVREI
jgi:hypothetical protein